MFYLDSVVADLMRRDASLRSLSCPSVAMLAKKVAAVVRAFLPADANIVCILRTVCNPCPVVDASVSGCAVGNFFGELCCSGSAFGSVESQRFFFV